MKMLFAWFIIASTVIYLAFFQTLVLAALPDCAHEYVVPKTMSCEWLAQSLGITVPELEAINPGLECNSDLEIGQFVCLLRTILPPKNPGKICDAIQVNDETNNCLYLSIQSGLTFSQLKILNPYFLLNCEWALLPGTWFCISYGDLLIPWSPLTPTISSPESSDSVTSITHRETSVRVAYIGTWSIKDNCQKLLEENSYFAQYTHIHFGMAVINEKYNVQLIAENDETLLRCLVNNLQGKNVKILLSVDGESSLDLISTDVSAASVHRKSFVNSVRSTLDKYELQGVDISWGNPFHVSSNQLVGYDSNSFAKLLNDLHQDLGQGKIISVSFPPPPEKAPHNFVGYDPIVMAPYVAYFVYPTFRTETCYQEGSKYVNIQRKEMSKYVQSLITDGVSKNKLVLSFLNDAKDTTADWLDIQDHATWFLPHVLACNDRPTELFAPN